MITLYMKHENIKFLRCDNTKIKNALHEGTACNLL